MATRLCVVNFVGIFVVINMLQMQSVKAAAFVASIDPTDGSANNKESAVPYDSVLKYLMNFDYLPKSDLETGALRTEEQFSSAIMELQRFGNIPVTGKVDAATLKLMRTPRCGLGDNSYANDFSADNLLHKRRKKRYVLQGAKWDRDQITWSLVNQTMKNAGRVRRSLAYALNVWERNSNVTFREVYSSEADIQVLFVRKKHDDGYNFDGPGNVLAHAFYPGVERGGDAHFDDDENWLVLDEESENGTKIIDVAVHEFGHSLGLGHSDTLGSIMYPWYQPFDWNKKIPDDDRLAIQELYGSRTKTWGPYRPPKTPPRPTTTTTTTTTITPRTRVFYPHTERPLYRPVTTGHRRYDISTTKRTPTRSYYKPVSRPDRCRTVYDAISMIHAELFIFRGQFYWRSGSRGLYSDKPHEIRRMWRQLPEDFKKIDAVYETKHQTIVFFIGRLYYMFHGTTLVAGYPKTLTELGLPSSLDRIDAAFTWGHNNATYLLSGSLYWRLDDRTGQVELDYPRDMGYIWKGVGYHVDAAFQYIDGKTYFFKGYHYWQFDDNRMQVTSGKPKLSSIRWMQCTNEVNDEDYVQHKPLVAQKNLGQDEHIIATSTATNNIFKAFTFSHLIIIILTTLNSN